MSNWEEMRSQSCDKSNVLSVDDIIALPIKTLEELQLLEKDLEDREFFKSMVNIRTCL